MCTKWSERRRAFAMRSYVFYFLLWRRCKYGFLALDINLSYALRKHSGKYKCLNDKNGASHKILILLK